ncbi:MAG: hypothetical protein ACT4OS_06385 [Acidimicrobiales bacterium]
MRTEETDQMRCSIAATAIAGTLMTGLGAGAAFFGPITAGAETDAAAFDTATKDSATKDSASKDSATKDSADGVRGRPDPERLVSGVIDRLVEDGTINRTQGDAVIAALREARPAHPGGPGPHGMGVRHGLGLAAAAEALGMTTAELGQALRDGQTMAQVAQAKGVDVQRVIDALVAEATSHLNQAVENGRLTRERADELIAELGERISTRVNEGHRPGGPEGRRPGGPQRLRPGPQAN